MLELADAYDELAWHARVGDEAEAPSPLRYDELGEPLRTSCGHRFHAVCLARHMESTEQDPSCPICRSGNLSARFPGTR